MVIISEIGEGSSSRSHDDHGNHKQQRHDVFLSFRGSGTRNNFIDHLYHALIDAGINTFFDDEEIDTGEDLKPELEDAIRSSRASVIVLFENYATSTWCLDELALILERHRVSDHIVIPIFYHVEPTDVWKQQNSFGDAMTGHRQKMEAETNPEKKVRWDEKIDRWYKALTEVADLKGKDVNGRREPDFIEEIVIEIRKRLGLPLSGTLPLLIGRNPHIEEITSWLTDGSSGHIADILTVSGMGGIGKTSLAKYVFHLHSREFVKSSFIESISLRCTGKCNGLLDVQKQLYDDISKKNKLPVHDTHVSTSMIKKALSHVKVFLVLDDIDSLGQLDALLGNEGFCPGSKIIITTRDASLTERCALFNPEVEPKHTKHLIEGLYEPAARELVCLHAFKCKDPKEGYEEVVEKLVKYCEGHPLALEVLGKSLYDQDIVYWEGCIETLKKERDSCIKKVLQMSFDSLTSDNDKELFKHIACFFVGIDRQISEKILKACEISTTLGISNLIERCLLRIGWGNRLMMHQLLQEMGKAVVREESDESGKHSLLWCHDESFKVLQRKKGTDRVKGLVLDTRMLEKEKFCDLKTDAFNNMDNLRILHLNYVQLSGSYEDFPKELIWLRMHGFPLKSLPADIPMEKLVVLDMSYSKIESFGTCCTSCNPQPPDSGQKVIGWCSKDKKILGSLKILDLSFCEQLHKLGGFYELPTLESLIVRNCKRLIEICELLEECVELVHIDLSYCVKLEKLPTAIHKLKKVKTLLLDDWNTHESILEQLVPSAISLPSSLVELSLANNNLSNESFPMDLSCLSSLKYLCLDENPIVSMPNCVRSLCSLEELSMVNCKTLMSIEHPPCTLKRLEVWWDYILLPMDQVSVASSKPLLQKISFDPDMSPISITVFPNSFRPWSFEIEGMVKIQALEGVEEKVLSSLGWTHLLDFLNIRQEVVTRNCGRGAEQSQIQMYYQFGIFSIIYGGQAMPDWITSTISSQTPISFTIPSTSKKQLRGLNFCYMQRKCYVAGAIEILDYQANQFVGLPTIEISNKTKHRTWIYKHCIEEFNLGGEWFTFFSHWMFGIKEMEAGDQIVITLKGEEHYQVTRKCGVGFVYDDGSMEEDALEYYKSWNHIIGGDLSSFQLTTGEYLLYHPAFTRSNENEQGLLEYTSKYKENTFPFRAFSKRKSPKIIGKGKVVGIGDHQPPLGEELQADQFRANQSQIQERNPIVSSSTDDHNHRSYDVFLSFRGEDTRNNFTDHLYKALACANLNTFLNDEDMETGLNLKPELESAIKASKVSVIVLSKNYAFSTRCLDELVLILDQHEKSKHLVIPVFYHVDRTHVRDQKSSFVDAMRKRAESNPEERGHWIQKMELWKKALVEVAKIEGKDVNGRLEAEFIEEITTHIRHQLGLPVRSTFPDLMGVEHPVHLITSWLKDGSTHSADILTIYGMGGIGKTTLAKYVFTLQRSMFQRSSFIDDINRTCGKQYDKLLGLQKQLWDDISETNSVQTEDVSVYTSKIENEISSKKVFIVLDDIDTVDQLNILLGKKSFHPGSKIIVTTRDASLQPSSYQQYNPTVQLKLSRYSVEGLDETSSLKLLYFNAFKGIAPKEGYKKVSKEFVEFCIGNPLALKVLGRSLRDKDVAEWEKRVEGFKTDPDSRIEKALRMSFDSLPSKNDKELFLHIACFFVGMDRDYTETILKACGIRTVLGIKNLLDRCLLTIGPGNKLMMHQLLQDMGKDVVRQESDKPWKRSRLWGHEESLTALKQNKGMGKIKGLTLDMRLPVKEKLHGSLVLKTDTFSKMDNLMLLQLNYVQLKGSYKNFPQQLRWLCMHQFPSKFVPSELATEYLVALDLSCSNFESFDLSCDNLQRPSKRRKLLGLFSKDKSFLGSLKILNLSFCYQLCSVGGFFQLPTLERLILISCTSLIEISESIELCIELVLIDLTNCYNLKKLPRSISTLKKLRSLLLDGCEALKVEALARDFKSLTISLPRWLVSLSLANCNLCNESFPMDFSSLSMLEELILDGNPIVSLLSAVGSLPRLRLLSLRDCEMLQSVETKF